MPGIRRVVSKINIDLESVSGVTPKKYEEGD